MVSMLSGTTKSLAAGLMSEPQKMENIIGMVRTVAPMTSPQTVSKINTYLPPFEKISTLLSMYSFLNRAQTFRPIESLNVKSPADMVTALVKNGNLPVGKMLAQPLIANNMDKIMGAAAANMMKNGNINDILSSLSKNAGTKADGSGVDLNSLMETLMPLINNMSTGSTKGKGPEENPSDNYEKHPEKIEFKNESSLQPDKQETPEHEETNEEFTYGQKNKKYDEPQNPYGRNHGNEGYGDYESAANYSENKNSSNRREPQKPIRIKQRRRRAL